MALDPDGNGIACEHRWPSGPTVVVRDEANGRLVEFSKGIVLGSVDYSSHRATDAEIAAGECAAGPPVTPETDAAPDRFTDLPATGGGSGGEQVQRSSRDHWWPCRWCWP